MLARRGPREPSSSAKVAGTLQASDRDALALVDLDDVAELPPPQKLPDTPRAHDRQLAPEPVERGQVEMVPVPVRDESGVQPAERRGRCSRRAAKVPEPAAQDRIREQPLAVHLDARGGMAGLRDSDRVQRPGGPGAGRQVAHDPMVPLGHPR